MICINSKTELHKSFRKNKNKEINSKSFERSTDFTYQPSQEHQNSIDEIGSGPLHSCFVEIPKKPAYSLDRR